MSRANVVSLLTPAERVLLDEQKYWRQELYRRSVEMSLVRLWGLEEMNLTKEHQLNLELAELNREQRQLREDIRARRLSIDRAERLKLLNQNG